MKKRGSCPGCAEIYEFHTSGVLKGIGVLASGLLGARLHPLVGLGLAVVSVIWGDKIEEVINARCPACDVALTLIGIVYG